MARLRHKFKQGDVIVRITTIGVEKGIVLKILNKQTPYYYLREIDGYGGLSGMFYIKYIDHSFRLDVSYLVHKLIGVAV